MTQNSSDVVVPEIRKVGSKTEYIRYVFKGQWEFLSSSSQ